MLVCILLFIIYIFFILLCLYTTTNLKPQKIHSQSNDGISIIVAIRNGESSLPNLINFLKKQDYSGPIEFILVDDESNDKTGDIILEASRSDSRFRYYSSNQGDSLLSHKKKALDVGIQNAKHNNLLFTDVDCLIPPTWVSSMSSYFSNGYNYLVGPSVVDSKNKVNSVSRFQRIDFLLTYLWVF